MDRRNTTRNIVVLAAVLVFLGWAAGTLVAAETPPARVDANVDVDKCPVAAFERKLLKRKVLTPAKIKSINDIILKQVEEACSFAADSPYPRPEDALQDVYSI